MVTQNWKRIVTRRHGPILRLDDFNHIYLVTLEHGDEAFDAVVKYVPYSTWSRIEQKNALRYSGLIGPHIHSIKPVPGGIEIIMEAAPFTLANYRQIALSTPDEQLFVARTLTDLLERERVIQQDIILLCLAHFINFLCDLPGQLPNLGVYRGDTIGCCHHSCDVVNR